MHRQGTSFEAFRAARVRAAGLAHTVLSVRRRNADVGVSRSDNNGSIPGTSKPVT